MLKKDAEITIFSAKSHKNPFKLFPEKIPVTKIAIKSLEIPEKTDLHPSSHRDDHRDGHDLGCGQHRFGGLDDPRPRRLTEL